MSEETRARAASLAAQRGSSIGQVVDEALEALETARFPTASTVSEAWRGQVWLTDFGVPVGHERGKIRPALVVSADSWNGHASTLTVLPMTRAAHDFPTRIEVEATAQNGLDETSYARRESHPSDQRTSVAAPPWSR